jgi:hypothetical protein
MGWESHVARILEMRYAYRILFGKDEGKIRDSSVGIALGYGLNDRGSRVRFPARAGNFSLHRAQNSSGPTQPPIQWVPGAISLEVKRPGHEADRSPPSSAEVKECVALYLHSHNTPSWRGALLKKKHRDNFTFKDEGKRPLRRPGL